VLKVISTKQKVKTITTLISVAFATLFMEGILQTSKIDDFTRAHKELRKDRVFIVNYKFFKKLITKLFKNADL